MTAESSLLYQNHESDNNGLRSPKETQRTIDLLLAEVTMLCARVDVLEAEVNWLREV